MLVFFVRYLLHQMSDISSNICFEIVFSTARSNQTDFKELEP